jgi:hypothetical protein
MFPYFSQTLTKCSNQIDIRILREMGVELSARDQAKIKEAQTPKLTPRQKFRAGVYAVIAAMRLSEMEEQWRPVKEMGWELEMKRENLVRRRSGVSAGKVRRGIREV